MPTMDAPPKPLQVQRRRAMKHFHVRLPLETIASIASHAGRMDVLPGELARALIRHGLEGLDATPEPCAEADVAVN